MLRNTAKSLYTSNISQTISYMDRELPQIISTIYYTSLFTIALITSIAYSISPYFLIGLIFLSASIFFSFKIFKSDLKSSEEIETFLKIKTNSLLDDLVNGNTSIKAANLEVYFGVKLGVYLERRVLIDMYKIGLKHLLSLRVYIFAILFVNLPVYLIIFFNFDGVKENQDSKNFLLMTMILVSLVPRMVDSLVLAMDDFYWHVCEVDDCLALTNFDSEVKVRKFLFFLKYLKKFERKKLLKNIF